MTKRKQYEYVKTGRKERIILCVFLSVLTIGSDESKIEETIEITGESDSSSGSITSSKSEEMQGSD